MVRPILYISGPYSAGNGRTVDDNISIARAHAVAAWERGWAAICPHLNTAHFEDLCVGVSYHDYVQGDLAILDGLDSLTAAVLLLPGWEQSGGASWEVRRAESRGIRILGPYRDLEEIPPPGMPERCEYSRRVYYETDVRDTCSYPGEACPPGKICPIRRRCR